MKSSRKSVKTETQNLVPRSVPDAAPRLIRIGKNVYDIDDAFAAALTIIEGLSFNCTNGDALYLAFGRALNKKPKNIKDEDWVNLINAIYKASDKTRQTNFLSRF